MNRKIIAYGFILTALPLLPGKILAAGPVEAKTSLKRILQDKTRSASLV